MRRRRRGALEHDDDRRRARILFLLLARQTARCVQKLVLRTADDAAGRAASAPIAVATCGNVRGGTGNRLRKMLEWFRDRPPIVLESRFCTHPPHWHVGLLRRPYAVLPCRPAASIRGTGPCAVPPCRPYAVPSCRLPETRQKMFAGRVSNAGGTGKRRVHRKSPGCIGATALSADAVSRDASKGVVPMTGMQLANGEGTEPGRAAAIFRRSFAR